MSQKNLSALPDAIKKRDILFGVAKFSTAALNEMAANFEAAGWLSDAMDFFNQIQDKEALKRIRTKTIPDGDVFLYLKACRLLDDHPENEILECGKRAEEKGKFRYALKAYERVESASAAAKEGIARIKEKIAQDADIVAEAASKVFIPEQEEVEV